MPLLVSRSRPVALAPRTPCALAARATRALAARETCALAARATRALAARLPALIACAALVALASPALAQAADPFARSVDYRHLPGWDGKWLNPRTMVWVLFQLHLLFAAFVLAVPMFVVIIEFIGNMTKDKAEAKRYDELGHEFTRLLTTAFSMTAILGAIATFVCLGQYPKFFNYLVEVFGPSMYLYGILFFGESFSLYLYYYGWGKFSKWGHFALGVLLNVFGVTLMLIANAWTTFMMAPGGVKPDGTVVDRHAAFFNYLLHPINIHRLIANLCLGGSVAAAYAAYKFLSTKDPEKRAHYDWMGYIGNFVAILFLLPLPFAGYYLGYEIYGYNQQLGIYMMGGVLSWMFILQAVLIGVLFLTANYYLWLGMDRIEGAERYRGWIKWLLAVVTLGVLVWATPKSLVLKSSEIEAMHGTSHPVISLFGVMSAKNTAVNLIILTTFLSFLLYKRGNKVPTVPWAKAGKMAQVALFAAAAAVVVVIGVGGYIPDEAWPGSPGHKFWWNSSERRIGMSPYQVASVLTCIVVVMAIDVFLFRKAKEIGRIRWGKVSVVSQYALLLLAITFTWTMGLMGFVRSSLRQDWHVYGIMKDESPWAYTPAIGYVTVIVTVVTVIFFVMVSAVFFIANLGAKHADEHAELPAGRKFMGFPLPAWGASFVVMLVAIALILRMAGRNEAIPTNALANVPWAEEAKTTRQAQKTSLGEYAQTKEAGKYVVPVDKAMDAILADPSLLHPVAMQVTASQDPAERGAQVFGKLQPCYTCHATSASDTTPKLGPHLYARWGGTSVTEQGEVKFDEAYVTESIKTPAAKIAKGFPPAMPPLGVPDDQIKDIIEYLKTLK